MLIFRKANDLRSHLQKISAQGFDIGFVPTMGALHEGHFSLVQAALENQHYTVVSIFVNPTQFNDPEDLKKYPRTEGEDLSQLILEGADVVFLPPVAEVYPPDLPPSPKFDFDGLDEPMEGKMRPGHFDGVAQVVNRLLDLVQPQHIYMGQKDFQQAAIVQRMLELTNRPTQLHRCPIIREENGLARSSRNVRLSANARQSAGIIYSTLREIKKRFLDGASPVELTDWAMRTLEEAGAQPEYVHIIDGHNLKRYKNFGKADFVVVCAAVWMEDVRLIDNVIIQGG